MSNPAARGPASPPETHPRRHRRRTAAPVSWAEGILSGRSTSLHCPTDRCRSACPARRWTCTSRNGRSQSPDVTSTAGGIRDLLRNGDESAATGNDDPHDFGNDATAYRPGRWLDSDQAFVQTGPRSEGWAELIEVPLWRQGAAAERAGEVVVADDVAFIAAEAATKDDL
jgi:hypothetical protein